MKCWIFRDDIEKKEKLLTVWNSLSEFLQFDENSFQFETQPQDTSTLHLN